MTHREKDYEFSSRFFGNLDVTRASKKVGSSFD